MTIRDERIPILIDIAKLQGIIYTEEEAEEILQMCDEANDMINDYSEER